MDKQRQKARENFREMRFGMFVHWGIYSLLGRGEWVMFHEKIPLSDYKPLMHRFNPHLFNAEEWVRLAQRAGMRYITITAKHHDGFCMYDSALTDYKITNSPFKRDVMQELAAACRKAKIALLFYYSPLDWQHPTYKSDWEAYTRYWHGQVMELVKKYRPYGIWLDGCWDKPDNLDSTWKLTELYKSLRALNPAILIGNNHHQKPLPDEDIQTYEQDLPGENTIGFNPIPPEETTLLETCMTINSSWGYNAADNQHKPPTQLIRLLAECAGRDANFLLNVGPKSDGTIQTEHSERLLEMGEWLQVNGKSIYATRGKVFSSVAWGTATRAGKHLYLHLWKVPEGQAIRIDSAPKIKSARWLATKQTVPYRYSGASLILDISEPLPDPRDSVVVLEV